MLKIIRGDCLDVMAEMPADSVDAIVTDPPYGLGFMGKHWDDLPPGLDWAKQCLRVLKPGGHLLAFGGTRTWHRLAVAVEDAGFEIRDSIAYFHLTQGQQTDILAAWRNWLNSASYAGARWVDADGSAPEPVLLSTNLARSPADAIIAELNSSEARHIDAARWRSVLLPADALTTGSSALVTIAVGQSVNHEARPDTRGSTAPENAPPWLSESIAARLKAATALKIWLGSKPSTRQAATDALCAALTDDLKLITCAQSKTFQNYDMTSQTVSVSATTVTTTACTAASLISFTADTLASRGGDATESSPGPLAWIYGSGFP